MNWPWVRHRWPSIAEAFWQHALLSVLPVLIGALIAVPLGALVWRRGWLREPVLALFSVVYAIPSLALFVVLPGLLGTRILDPVNVVVALTLYTVALLVRVVVDALAAVPPEVRDSAHAMGYRPAHRLVTVDLPLAAPVIGAGLRVVTVANVSLVAIAAMIGVPQLGSLFTEGYQSNFATPIVVGIAGCVLLALTLDVLLVLGIRALTPWARAGGPAPRRQRALT